MANFASTAVSNTLPGGGALGVGVTVTIERSYGFAAADIARAAVPDRRGGTTVPSGSVPIRMV